VLSKRYQDGVRAVDLLPLPESEARKKVVLERYELFQPGFWAAYNRSGPQ
jgi:hypothetical protein